jgi:hypothetical protein
MSKSINKTSRLKRLQKIQQGLGKHFQGVTQITLGGTSYTLTELTALLQGDLDAMTLSGTTDAAHRTAVAAERLKHAQVDPVLRLFKALVISQFGDSPASAQALEDFGYAPRPPSTRTVKAKAAAQVKAKATREARHTMGPKQKQEITGSPATPQTPKA